MAEALPSQLVVQTTAEALREKRKLRRNFRHFDMLFYLICAVACFDGAGPSALGRFSSRFGTPVAMNLLSGTVATVLMVVGVLFYALGRPTRQDVATEPVTADYGPADTAS